MCRFVIIAVKACELFLLIILLTPILCPNYLLRAQPHRNTPVSDASWNGLPRLPTLCVANYIFGGFHNHYHHFPIPPPHCFSNFATMTHFRYYCLFSIGDTTQNRQMEEILGRSKVGEGGGAMHNLSRCATFLVPQRFHQLVNSLNSTVKILCLFSF